MECKWQVYRGPGARVGSKNLFVITTQLKPGKAHLPEGSLLIICPTLKRNDFERSSGIGKGKSDGRDLEKDFPS